MPITILSSYLDIIRGTLDRMIPSIANSELFSSAVVAGIATRMGIAKETGRERTTLQDSELARRHGIFIKANGSRIGLYGRGVSDRGCRLLFQVSIPSNQRDDGFVFDPHGLWCPRGYDATFEKIVGNSPIQWVKRQLSKEGCDTPPAKVRRFSDENTREFVTEWLEEYKQFGNDMIVATDEDKFFRAFCHATALVEGKGEAPFAVIKSGTPAQLLASWPIEGEGYGFLRAASQSETIPNRSVLFLTPEAMRVLAGLFDRNKQATCARLRFSANGSRTDVRFVHTDGTTVDVFILREHTALATESRDSVLEKAKLVIRKVNEGMPTQWSLPRPLDRFSEGLLIASSFAPAIAGQEEHSGVRVDMNFEDATGDFLFRGRNFQQSAIFRLTPPVEQKPTEHLTLTTAQARSLSRMVRVLSTDYGMKSGVMRFVQQDVNEIFVLRDMGDGAIIAGCLVPRSIPVEDIFGRITLNPGPNAPLILVGGDDIIDAASFVYSGVGLSGINDGKRNSELVEPSGLQLGNGVLRIFAGNDVCHATTAVPLRGLSKFTNPEVYRRGTAWLAVLTNGEKLRQAFLLLDRVRRMLLQGGKEQQEADRQLLIQFYGPNKEPGLFLTLIQNKMVLAKIVFGQAWFATSAQTGNLPQYTQLRPETEAESCTILPNTPTLLALHLLHSAFQADTESLKTSPMMATLAGMHYSANETFSPSVCAGSRQRVVSWSLGERALGSEDAIFPPGFFEAALHFRRYKPETTFHISRKTVSLQQGETVLVFRKRLPETALQEFPLGKFGDLLSFPAVDYPPSSDGLAPGMGVNGYIIAEFDPMPVLERLSAIKSESGAAHLAWLWDQQGRHQLIPEEHFGPNIPIPTPLTASLMSWQSSRPIFFLCVGMQLLESTLRALCDAERAAELSSDIIHLQLRPKGVRFQTDNYLSLVMPLQINEENAGFLKTITSLES